MNIHLNLGERSYDIVMEQGCLKKAGELLNLNRKVLIVTDSGVPETFADILMPQCKAPVIVRVESGEKSKSLETYGELQQVLSDHRFSRKDCVVALGGGVVGDLAGFVAATYMRGIDFYNIPTTVLSQVDSSIGGKTAINLGGIKNIVGAFYQPRRVLIDTTTLTTLPPRQISNGLAEALKMSMTFDRDLFELFEKEDPTKHLDEIICRSVQLKQHVVEEDEKEAGLRKVLNFGHTIGHGIESYENLNGLYHGECVSLGMICMSSPAVRERLIPVLGKLNLPTALDFDTERVYDALSHDKKADGATVSAVYVNEIGSFEVRDVPLESLRERIAVLK